MSTVGMSVANTEYDAAQALLDLQSNVRESNHEQHDRKESVEAAKLFLSCFIASNVVEQPIKALPSPKVETDSPKYAVVKSTTRKSDVATTHSLKRKTPDQELTRAHHNNTYDSVQSSNKRSKTFKRKPMKHFTVSSVSVPSSTAKKNNISEVSEAKVKIRDVGTQTEDKYQLPIIKTMEFTISKLCEKIKSLEEQIKTNSQPMDTIDHDVSYNDNDFDDDDDESYKVKSHKMTMDDSDSFDSELDETFTDRETPEKVQVKTQHKAGQYNEYSNTAKVPIGDGNAVIPSRIFRHVNWNSYTSATRKLLTAVFTRRILATHSLTGKPSPAFPNKPAKKKLDPVLVSDIVQTVVERCCVPENVVRTSITTKCADESKMFRTRQNNKKKRKHTVNRENISPDSDSYEF